MRLIGMNKYLNKCKLSCLNLCVFYNTSIETMEHICVCVGGGGGMPTCSNYFEVKSVICVEFKKFLYKFTPSSGMLRKNDKHF